MKVEFRDHASPHSLRHMDHLPAIPRAGETVRFISKGTSPEEAAKRPIYRVTHVQWDAGIDCQVAVVFIEPRGETT